MDMQNNAASTAGPSSPDPTPVPGPPSGTVHSATAPSGSPDISPGEDPKPGKLDDTHALNSLMKEYELATNRLDKTDDRIIQLVGIGIAFAGAVFLLLRELQTEKAASTTLTGPTVTVTATVTTATSATESDLGCRLGIFVVSYAILCASFLILYRWRGQRRGVGKAEQAGTPRHDVNVSIEEGIGPKSLGFAYVAPGFFGVLVIIMIAWLSTSAPVSGNDLKLPSLELLWLMPLAFVAFNSLVIYVMYSSFGNLWLCRALSQRVNLALKRPVLMRFERRYMLTRFFSYRKGNWKPRMSYWLLLASVGVLFCSAIVLSYAHIHTKMGWYASLFLALYLFLLFLQLFTLSGIPRDMENKYSQFLKEDAATFATRTQNNAFPELPGDFYDISL